jgi:hypothetical protein
VTLAFGRLRQKDGEFENSPWGYIVMLCLKKKGGREGGRKED